MKMLKPDNYRRSAYECVTCGCRWWYTDEIINDKKVDPLAPICPICGNFENIILILMEKKGNKYIKVIL